MAFVSKHPSLWKPGAASPKPSNKVQCGSGLRALSGASEEAGKGKGWITPFSRLEARTGHLGWAGEGEEGGRGGRTRQVLKD